jgi:hypothetical protein
MSSPGPTNKDMENTHLGNIEDVKDVKFALKITDIVDKGNTPDTKIKLSKVKEKQLILYKKTLNLLDKINSKFEYKKQKTENGITYDDLDSGLINQELTKFLKPKFKVTNEYIGDEKERLKNFNELAPYLRKLYYFFGNEEIDSRLDLILSRLTPERHAQEIIGSANGNRRYLGISFPIPSKHIIPAIPFILWLPLSAITSIMYKASDAIRIISNKFNIYETDVNKLQKYVIDKGILTEAEGADLDRQINEFEYELTDKPVLTSNPMSTSEPTSGGKTRNNRQSKKLTRKPKRKGGRKSRKH